jgi:hypothetical protein
MAFLFRKPLARLIFSCRALKVLQYYRHIDGRYSILRQPGGRFSILRLTGRQARAPGNASGSPSPSRACIAMQN